MSKGLGTLQREILAEIDQGLGASGFGCAPLPEGVIERDLLRWNMALKRGQKHGNTPATRSFSAAFSRAFKGLVARGFVASVALGGTVYYRRANKDKS